MKKPMKKGMLSSKTKVKTKPNTSTIGGKKYKVAKGAGDGGGEGGGGGE